MLAFTFPGQGSQSSGMGAPWTDHPSWELVAAASDAAGRDVEELLLTATIEELTETHNAQLATFVMSIVTLDALERAGVHGDVTAGHSLGEYSALVAADAVDFYDGVRLVAERGAAMKEAAEKHPGTMAAVLGMEPNQINAVCSAVDGEVWPANFNSHGQVIIAGSHTDVKRAGVSAKELGAKRVIPLKVGGAFHTPHMAPAQKRLNRVIDNTHFRDTTIPVVCNVDATDHTAAADFPTMLRRQLTSPVLWAQSLARLGEMGVTTLVEVGTGGVLTGLAKRELRSAEAVSVGSPEDLDGLARFAAEKAIAAS